MNKTSRSLANLLLLLLLLIVSFAVTPAIADNRARTTADANQPDAVFRKMNDHPLAQPIANKEVKIEVTYDKILRSCCAPPNLVLVGKLTNVSSKPIDYLKLTLTFRNDKGEVVYKDQGYNHKAVTLGEDPMVSQALNEKPHFEPLPPGDKDTFYFQEPLPEVPRYRTCQVGISEIKRNAQLSAAR